MLAVCRFLSNLLISLKNLQKELGYWDYVRNLGLPTILEGNFI